MFREGSGFPGSVEDLLVGSAKVLACWMCFVCECIASHAWWEPWLRDLCACLLHVIIPLYNLFVGAEGELCVCPLVA